MWDRVLSVMHSLIVWVDDFDFIARGHKSNWLHKLIRASFHFVDSLSFRLIVCGSFEDCIGQLVIAGLNLIRRGDLETQAVNICIISMLIPEHSFTHGSHDAWWRIKGVR